jgi:FtsZ-binding cell division protein ZapB
MATKKNSDKPQGRKAKLEAKLADKVGSDVVDTLNSASADELREKLSSLAKHEDETEEALEKDEEIERLTEELKQMKAPYKDTLSGIKLQRSFIAILLRERGRQAKLAPVQAPN